MVQSTVLTSWAQELESCIGTDRRGVDGPRGRVREIIRRLQTTEVTVAFGGHFSSGKSTVLNAVLGRPLLPVDDYPETGAICTLRGGQQDAAEVWTASGRRAIPCTTDAIRDQVELVSASGELQDAVGAVERLDLALGGATIPAGARLVDCPGTNDTAAMNRRAWQGAELADVLVWVVSSRQPLSETEVEFLAAHVQAKGPAALAFVLNVFLDNDTPTEWGHALGTVVPYCEHKLRHRAEAMGLGDGAGLDPVVVAGRAAGRDANGGFGGDALRQTILELALGEHRQVRAARLHRAAGELDDLVDTLTADQRRAEQAAERAKAQAREQQRDRERFERTVRVEVEGRLKDWQRLAGRSEAAIAVLVTPSSLARDGSYGRRLTASLRQDSRNMVDGLAAAVTRHAKQHGQRPLSAAARGELLRILEPPELRVMVPQGTERNAAKVGAVVGGVIGFILGGGPPGAALGAALGGAGGAAIRDEGKDEAVAGTKANIKAAVAKASSDMMGRRDLAVTHILDSCARRPSSRAQNNGVPSSDREMLQTMRRLSGEAHEFSQLALV